MKFFKNVMRNMLLNSLWIAMFVALWPIPSEELWWRLSLSIAFAGVFGFFQELFRHQRKREASQG